MDKFFSLLWSKIIVIIHSCSRNLSLSQFGSIINIFNKIIITRNRNFLMFAFLKQNIKSILIEEILKIIINFSAFCRLISNLKKMSEFY